MVDEDFEAQAKFSQNWPYAGYHMTIYLNAEEYSVERYILEGKMPFYVADALQIAGDIVESGSLDKTYVVRDRELITGQNPAQTMQSQRNFLRLLRRKTSKDIIYNKVIRIKGGALRPFTFSCYKWYFCNVLCKRKRRNINYGRKYER